MALRVYLTAATGMLNLKKDSDPVFTIPSQHVIYDYDGASFKFYRKDLKKGSGFMYGDLAGNIQDSGGIGVGPGEAAVRAYLDPIIGVQKTV